MSETDPQAVAKAPTRRSTTPITKVKTLQELFDHDDLKKRMVELVPKHLDPTRMLKTFTLSVLKTPGLAKASPLSMLGCAMTCAFLGLEPNTPLGLIYLIPFDVNQYNKATKKFDYVRTDVNPIVGYEGYIDLINRGRFVKDIDCQVIWPGDTMEFERGSNQSFRHIPRFKQNANSEPDFAYMFARTVNGGQYVELMTRADVHKIRNMSQGYRTAITAKENADKNSWAPPKAYTEAPWIKHSVAMWRKTPLRAGQKWLPGRTPEMALAANLDEMGDLGRVRFDRVLDVEQVIEGDWEVGESDYEQGDQPEQTEATKTQVQGSTMAAGSAAQPDPKTEPSRQPAQRKAAAKQATTAAPAASDDEPPDDGRWGPSDGEPVRQQDAPVVSPRGAAAGAAPEVTETNLKAVASGVSFDAFVLDESSDPISDAPIEDVTAWARAFGDALLKSARPESMIEANADTIDDIRKIGETLAVGMIDTDIARTRQKAQPAEPEVLLGVIVVTLTTERGKPNEQKYREDFEAEVQTLVAGNFVDFIDLNRPTMLKVRKSYRSLLVKALEIKGNSVGLPLTPAVKTALMADPPAEAAPGQSPGELDQNTLRNRLADIAETRSKADLAAYGAGPVLVRFKERMLRENKLDMLQTVDNAFREKMASFGA
jgi:recombination protein RecT